ASPTSSPEARICSRRSTAVRRPNPATIPSCSRPSKSPDPEEHRMRVANPLVVTAGGVRRGPAPFAPPAQAANNVTFTVGDAESYEYVKDCSTQAPYPCTTSSLTMYVE